MKSNKKKKPLGKLKEEVDDYLLNNDIDGAIKLCNLIIELYPVNNYGYHKFISIKTDNYNKYLPDDELKLLKCYHDKDLEYATRATKKKIMTEYDDYKADCIEVNNLVKLKKEIIGNRFMKKVYEGAVINLNNSKNVLKTYDVSGKRIKNIYDFIKGLFLFGCLIFNLFTINNLLIITIPFGIYGLINIYSFLDLNFFKMGNHKLEKKRIDTINDMIDDHVLNFKDEIKKLNTTYDFLLNQKTDIMLKIPSSFNDEIESLINYDEDDISKQMINALDSKNIPLLILMLNEHTNYNGEDVVEKINNNIQFDDKEVEGFITSKLLEKKNKQIKLSSMKQVTKMDYLLLMILLIISVFTSIVLINNFYEMNIQSFVLAVGVGIISILIYNINNGKAGSLIDTFNDNLLSCVFNMTLIYDLAYSYLTNGLNFTYNFIEMPIIFALIIMGYVMLMSLLKYKYLFKRLRG